MARRPTLPDTKAREAAEKNKPLVEDIRLLGRILGDVIREQEGKEAFELVERVRQLSVAYRLKADASAGRVLDQAGCWASTAGSSSRSRYTMWIW